MPAPGASVPPTYAYIGFRHTQTSSRMSAPVIEYVYSRRQPTVGSTRLSFSADEWMRLAGLYGFIGLLHVLGWGLYLHYATDYPALVGLGFVAYMFGLRHAFDADHIAAIDDTVRYLLQKGKKPLGIGFFFSLGHSTIVLCLAVAIAFAASAIAQELPALKNIGGILGASVSGVFLWIIGILNLLVLLDILGVWKKAKTGTHDHQHLEELLLRSAASSIACSAAALQKFLNHSWQMYPLGLLFGLGFDTASEVGLLAMTAGASAGNLPIPAVLCAADPVRRGHVADGHHRRRAHVEGLQLGVPEPAAEDLLQHHDDQPVRSSSHW